MGTIIEIDKEGKYKKIFDSECTLTRVSDIIYWNRGNNSKDHSNAYFQNMMTGVRSHSIEEVVRYKTRNIYIDGFQDNFCTCNFTKGYFVKYIEEFDVVALYEYSFSMIAPQEGEKRNWFAGSAVYVMTRDGKCFVNNAQYCFPRGSIVSRFDFDICEESFLDNGSFQSALYDKHVRICRYTINTMKKLYGNGFCFGHEDVWMLGSSDNKPFPEFNRISEDGMPTEEELKKAEELNVGRELPPIDKKYLKEQKLEFPLDEDTSERLNTKMLQNWTMKRFAVVQKIGESQCVIRLFSSCVYAKKIVGKVSMKDLDVEEYGRIYLKGYEKPVICEKYFDKWYVMENRFDKTFECMIYLWNPEDSKGTTLSYFDDIMTNIYHSIEEETEEGDIHTLSCVKAIRSKYLITLLNSPYVNNIYSSGMDNIKYFLMKLKKYQSGNMNSMIARMFGLPMNVPYDLDDEWDRSILKDSGYPKHMFVTLDAICGKALKEMAEEEREERRSERKMGYIASTAFNVFHDIVLYFEEYPDYLRNMNRDQFSELANTIYDCMRQIPWEHKLTYNDRRHLAIRDIVSMRGPKQILSYVKYVFCEKEEATKNDTLGFDFFAFDSLYCDYLSMAYNLKDTENRIEHPQYKFDSLEEVQTAHDNILFIYDMATDKKNFGEKQSLFEQVWTKEKCDRYQYEGDTFSVLAPKNVMEIANEGTVLHHCVKSYIDNVAHDVTNILFIRRNENLEKPFYTLEIQNDEVRQCHGFGNCNIEKEEGLEEFLKEYCKKKDFSFKTADRVMAAT